ncbi:disease resistance protein RGA2-like [Ipomoea triloba]|uniref:disease resistance protein RGA2-like n=1 Tax=Ipomoea triloba TaxID=35885 RepID=UPI00125E8A23|nr:disease resistance protein RGA2-like [Ipomoea triloba]
MADTIVSKVVEDLYNFMKDKFQQELSAALGVEKEIQNLSSKLNKIRQVLDDAERKSFKEKHLKLWLQDIQAFCYDVEDVLDEWRITTPLLRLWMHQRFKWGKTTLAQLVYGDERIKSHFDKRVWVCVSQPFDQIKIAKAIVESSTTGSSPNLSELEVLLKKIQNTLSQKRFLLVLDDVWTEDDAKWAPFKNCLLMVGIPGSRILVTSRSERVAKMMGSVYLHRVKLISDSDAWLLLSRIAFSKRTEEASEKLKEIGQKNFAAFLLNTFFQNNLLQICSMKLPNEIGNLIHLRYINLSWSNIEELPDSIYSLYNLQTLDLSRCWYLSRLPEGIGNLRLLGKIDLSWNKVEELPDSICSLESLQTLYLRECHSLSRLPEGIGNLHHLRKIYLTWSKVEELPDSICSLDNLQTLDLNRCGYLSRLPEGIGNLRLLGKIDLSWSKVEELPDSICSLDNLQTLYLRECHSLSRLPERIGNLHHLRKIYLTWSKVEELPDSICSLDNLEILDLYGCKCLSRLPEGIGNLHHLREIDLNFSKVKKLPDSIYSLNKLEIRGWGTG